MDYRNHYIYLNPDDFKFVKPEREAKLNKPKEEGETSAEKIREIKEEEGQKQEYNYEKYDDYNDDVNEVQSGNELYLPSYKPSISEIDEWRQAVAALSSRTVMSNGRLFGDLEPVPFVPTLDPSPGSCFNCWQVGHPSRNCPAPRAAFCINCGRRDESVATCPRCSRQQRDFFARRRAEEQRSRGEPNAEAAGRSTSEDRQETKLPKAEEVANKDAPSRIRDYSQRTEAEEEEPQVACGSGEIEAPELPTRREAAASTRIDQYPKDYRGSFGGKEAGEVVASESRPRRRRNRRPKPRSRRNYPAQSVSLTGEGKIEDEEERRETNEAREPRRSLTSAGAARRGRPMDTVQVTECTQEAAAAGTESRYIEAAQRTGEDHVARERQRILGPTEGSRDKCENVFVGYFRKLVGSKNSRFEPKKRSEEQNIPMDLESEEYVKLLDEVNHLGVEFSKLMMSMKLSQPEIEQTLVLLKEIRNCDRNTQELIILDELLLKSRQLKWWKPPGNEDTRTFRFAIPKSKMRD